jgi:putative spermidine/putrescine transport system permease protein
MKKIIKYILLISFIFYIIFPIITNLILSFSNVWQWPSILPSELTIKHYAAVFNQGHLLKAIFNTSLIGFTVIIFNYFLAIPSAYALSRLNSKYKPIIITSIILPVIVPPILVLLNLYNHFLVWELTDHYLGVIIAHMIPSLPYMFIMLYLSFEKVDADYERIILSLGVSPIKGFFTVILPQVKEGIILGGIMTLLISISQYLSTLLIGGGRILTLTLLLTPYIQGGNARVGAAYGIILILLCTFLIYFYEKTLLGGKNA